MRTDSAVASGTVGWGRLPFVALISASGLLLVAIGYTAGRSVAYWADPVYWAGILMIFIPIALRLLSARASRQERLGLVCIIGLELYLVKVLNSPSSFTYHDELLHWRTTFDILQSGHLFQRNSLLPISPLYPGLENIATALINLSGLTIFDAGVVLIGVGRLLLVLALFLFYEEISRSTQVAGLATLLYMANPNFVYFGAQFSYESLALPLAALALAVLVLRSRFYAGSRVGLNLVALIVTAAIITTHHITTYSYVGFLIIWTLVSLLLNILCSFLEWYAGKTSTSALFRFISAQIGQLWSRVAGNSGDGERAGYGCMAPLALIAGLTWTVYVASLTINYLAPNITGGLSELFRLITTESGGRQLFRSATGDVAPLWEQLNGYAAVLFILLWLPIGLLQLRRKKGLSDMELALGAIVLTYPATLALRFTSQGLEVSNRTSEFLFVALAFVIATGMIGLQQRIMRFPPRVFSVLLVGCALIIFTGGVIIGWPRWARLPGPYLVVADTRSIEAEGIETAFWARTMLGANNRIAADRINGILMDSYGDQNPVTISYDNVDVPEIFFASTYDASVRSLIEQGAIKYIIVDKRLGNGLPTGGVYFDYGESNAFQHKTPISAAALNKFDNQPGISKVYDSGDLAIYAVGGTGNAP